MRTNLTWENMPHISRTLPDDLKCISDCIDIIGRSKQAVKQFINLNARASKVAADKNLEEEKRGCLS